MESTILVLFYSKNGSTKALAQHITRGIDSVPGCRSMLRTVPPLNGPTGASGAIIGQNPIPDEGVPYVTKEELRNASGLLLGSPVYFAGMAGPLKVWIDTLSDLWFQGSLEGKPAGVFTSGSSLHGGQESTLLSMGLPLLHLGMLLVGVPYSVPELHDTESGGTPYGASHYEKDKSKVSSPDEKAIAQALGARVARIAQALDNSLKK